jgi:organic radical activating enzyme
MNKIIKVIQEDDAPMQLTWVINNICPNACSYCPANLHNGKNHNYDWENARKFFHILFEKYPRIHCSIAGGEPSVSPFLKEIVKEFYDRGHTVSITTNGAKPVHFWEEISPYVQQICFSYHPEFPDKNFIEKVQASARHCPTTVRVMMYHKYWQQSVDMYDECFKYRDDFHTEAVRITRWGEVADNTSHIYTDEQLAWFKTNKPRASIDWSQKTGRKNKWPKLVCNFLMNDGELLVQPNVVELINQGLTDFSGWSCDIGLKSLFVDPKGNIRRANCHVGGRIGNINSPTDIEWPTASIICNDNCCDCATDVNISKYPVKEV